MPGHHSDPQSLIAEPCRELMSDGLRMSVVIVNHNGGQHLHVAVGALQANTAEQSAEIIVVDSASSDRSAERLPDGPLPVRFLACEQNVGFCAGNNLGVSAARGEVIVFTQPDGEVAPRWDEPLLEALRTRSVAAAGGLVIKQGPEGRGLIDSAGMAIAPNLGAWSLREWMTPEEAALGDEPLPVPGVSPAFLAIRKADHEHIGGFWEPLWMYGDEPDYALRVRRLGEVLLCPKSRMLHHVGASLGSTFSPLRLYLGSRNRILNASRHLPLARLLPALCLTAVFDLLYLIKSRDRTSMKAIGRGWFAGLRGMRAARATTTAAQRSANVPNIATVREYLANRRPRPRAVTAGRSASD